MIQGGLILGSLYLVVCVRVSGIISIESYRTSSGICCGCFALETRRKHYTQGWLGEPLEVRFTTVPGPPLDPSWIKPLIGSLRGLEGRSRATSDETGNVYARHVVDL